MTIGPNKQNSGLYPVTCENCGVYGHSTIECFTLKRKKILDKFASARRIKRLRTPERSRLSSPIGASSGQSNSRVIRLTSGANYHGKGGVFQFSPRLEIGYLNVIGNNNSSGGVEGTVSNDGSSDDSDFADDGDTAAEADTGNFLSDQSNEASGNSCSSASSANDESSANDTFSDESSEVSADTDDEFEFIESRLNANSNRHADNDDDNGPLSE